MPIANSDRVPDEFMPGIRSGAPSLAPGTPGASGDAADDTGAGPVTLPTGAWQPAARYPASTGGTVEPGQSEPTAISTGPQAGYTDTGAGSGHAGHFPRRPWQQSGGA